MSVTRLCRTAIALCCALFLVSCSDSGTPVSPSAQGGSPGATIQGFVNPGAAPTGAASFSATNIGSGTLTIRVVGTEIDASVGPNGQFTIVVPPGPVQLQFVGQDVNAMLDLGVVAPNETREIVVRVSGSNAVLESQVTDDASSDTADDVSDDTSSDGVGDDDSADDDSADDDSTDDASSDDDSSDDDSMDDDASEDSDSADDAGDDDSEDDDSSDSDSDDDSEDDDSSDSTPPAPSSAT